MKAGEAAAYTCAVLIPLAGLVAGLCVVLLPRPVKQPPASTPCTANSECGAGACVAGACVCQAGFTGPACNTAVLAAMQSLPQLCTDVPRPCTSNSDCANCGNPNLGFQCSDLTAGQATSGVAGKYCTPQQPQDACRAVPAGVPPSEQVPGVYLWEGWKAANAQAWSCNCASNYYPADAADGACRKSSALCRHGTWEYPTPGHKVGDAPATAGACTCDAVPCTKDSECAVKCGPNKVCVQQRLGMDPKAGLPTCVPDTCAPHGSFKSLGGNYPAYGRCVCNPGYENNGYSCVAKAAVKLRKSQAAPAVLAKAHEAVLAKAHEAAHEGAREAAHGGADGAKI